MTALPTLRHYQVEAGRAIVDSVVNGRGLSFTVVMARQSGKNELSAQIELFLLLRNARFKIDAVKAAPTFKPQCEISIDRLWLHAACLEGVSPFDFAEVPVVDGVNHPRDRDKSGADIVGYLRYQRV